MTLLSTPSATLGMQAPEFSLKSTDDEMMSLADYADEKLLVVTFLCNHCPYVLAILSRFNGIADEYMDRGAAFIAINPNDAKAYPDDSFMNMKKLPIACDYLHDATQEVAKAYGAVCTPDIFVFDAQRKLVYRGRIDDGDKRDPNAVPENHDLRNALDLLLEDKAIDSPQIPSMGCSIKWKE